MLKVIFFCTARYFHHIKVRGRPTVFAGSRQGELQVLSNIKESKLKAGFKMANHSKPAMMTVGAHLSIFVLILKVQVLCAIPPQIVPFKLPDDLEEGQRLIITCAIRKGTPPFVFFWQKNGRPLAETNGTRIVHNDDYQETLKIQTLGGDDVANYTCAVENAFGSDQISVAVLLKFKPRWNVPGKENSVITGVAGDSIMFDCSAIGYPTPAIRIFKGK